jgi:FG-GAP repeat/FG-GAP-like repeat
VIQGGNHDVNGDGYPDVSIGSPGKGLVDLYFSQGATGLPSSPSAVLSDPAGVSGDDFGFSMVWGDFNGDGYADLAVGSDGYSGSRGQVYIYYSQGGKGLPSTPSLTLSDPLGSPNDLFGHALAAGDTNADGFTDLAIGSHGYSNTEGQVYVYSGGAAGLSTIPAILSDPADLSGDAFGAVLALADVNGDGNADLVVGSQGYSSNSGRVYVFYSKGTSGYATSPSLTLSDPPAANNDLFGGALALGDFNGDGYADLAVGSQGVGVNQGLVYIFQSAGTSGLGASANVTLSDPGATSQDLFGNFVAVGDMTGDGYADLIVGSPGATSGQGKVYGYVSQGSSGIGTTPSLTVIDPGAAGSDQFGSSVAVCDVNADGYGDLILSAPGTSNGQGRVYVYQSQGGSSGQITYVPLTLFDPNAANGDLFGEGLGR